MIRCSPWLPTTRHNSGEAAEIEALKKEIQALEQKVQRLEQQREAEPQAATDTNQERIQDLDQKVRILERQRELDQEDAAAAAKTQPRLSLGANGFTLQFRRHEFCISLHGVLQVDSRTFFDDGDNKATTVSCCAGRGPIFHRHGLPRL